MNANLEDLISTRNNLNRVIYLDGHGYLRDEEVRYIAREGLKKGYKTLHDIPDDWASAILIGRNVQQVKPKQLSMQL